MRDNFSQKTKDLLASRVGYRCSNPKCRIITRGSCVDKEKFINIGVAAHIYAAAFGGPRFNKNMTPEERKSPSNGIWLCQRCAKLIDSDTNKYTVECLKKWKSEAEKNTQLLLEGDDEKEKGLDFDKSESTVSILIDIKGEIKLTDESYNKFFVWFVNGYMEKIKVKIVYEVLEKAKLFIEPEVDVKKRLTEEEKKWYMLYTKAKKDLLNEKENKELAIHFFLQDKNFLAYYNASCIEDILKIIFLIIQDTGNNTGYDSKKEILVDCYLNKNIKRNIDGDYHFSLPLKTNLLKEIFKVEFLQFISGDVASLGYDLVVNKIASRFYLFLAEIYTYGNRALLSNSYFINMFHYQIGLH